MTQSLIAIAPCRRSEPPVRWKRTPRRRRAAVSSYGTLSRRDGLDPAELVAEMQRAGAVFRIRANAERNDFRYVLCFKDGADVERCKAIVAEVRADPELMALFRVAVFAAIAREAWRVPARSP